LLAHLLLPELRFLMCAGTFVDIVAAAARKVRRHVVVLRDAGAAPDHTLDPHFPHGKYMTNLLVRVNGP
jgi:23S rRNA G2069 N7-methylase RlmK/C1962 C5-methylase RlmI